MDSHWSYFDPGCTYVGAVVIEGSRREVKYKNIYSAIHNFGHSFLSLMNYVDGDYVIDELSDIISRGYDIEIDWLNNRFTPKHEATPRIIKSMDYYFANLKRHLQSQHVDVNRIKAMKLCCPTRGRKYMWAKDDRGKEYKIYVSEIK